MQIKRFSVAFSSTCGCQNRDRYWVQSKVQRQCQKKKKNEILGKKFTEVWRDVTLNSYIGKEVINHTCGTRKNFVSLCSKAHEVKWHAKIWTVREIWHHLVEIMYSCIWFMKEAGTEQVRSNQITSLLMAEHLKVFVQNGLRAI